MTTLIQTPPSQKKTQPSKNASQVAIAPKPQPSGLSREEIRQIVLEIMG